MDVYFDTSALAKLIVREFETRALEAWLDSSGAVPVSSVVARVELMRFARRHGDEEIFRVASLAEKLDFLTLSDDVVHLAGSLDPALLRSLDAIHLATALDLGSIISGVVTYDKRLAEACALHGLEVIAPSE